MNSIAMVLRTLPTAAVLVSTSLFAQAPDQAKMKANFEEMKQHDWYVGAGWTCDFDAAKAEAKKTGKPIFAYFTRTYAP